MIEVGDATSGEISAAKLHVLHLEPIKEKLGARWPRLSDLVHTLFEKALKSAQGPSDHFISMGELSYIVTFHELSTEEASLACAAVAQEVCELLFGDDIGDISVRSLVGRVPVSSAKPPVNGETVAAILENGGKETIATKLSPLEFRRKEHSKPSLSTDQQSNKSATVARRLPQSFKRTPGYFPLWDLQSLTSSIVFLGPYAGIGNSTCATVRRLFAGEDEKNIVDAEILLFRTASEYARRMQSAQKICAIGVGVSYETLSGFHSRIRYIGALKATQNSLTSSFLLKIEQIPEGVPLGRLAEMIAMMRVTNLRVLLEFSSGATIADLDVRLGAHGIGTILPENCPQDIAIATAQRVARQAAQQKAFAFLGGLSNEGLVEAARQNQIRFGMGSSLGGGIRDAGPEKLPDFPLVVEI